MPFERVRRGELTEVTFEFNCWLAPEMYSLCIAVHSSAAVSFDWLDGCLFFRVMSPTKMEGVTNLNATARSKRLAGSLEKDLHVNPENHVILSKLNSGLGRS